jgi:Predicted flavoprotein involved in K+ transport
MQVERVAVIGAGPCGLGVAKYVPILLLGQNMIDELYAGIFLLNKNSRSPFLSSATNLVVFGITLAIKASAMHRWFLILSRARSLNSL